MRIIVKYIKSYTQVHMEIITLTTDFGLSSGYPAAMKGVIYNINPNIKLVDITHSLQPQNILQGAFMLYSVVEYFHATLHVAVVDPGVGSPRSGLVMQCGDSILVGPDNGLLVPAAERLGIKKIFKITNTEYCLGDISSTFHGRDIFAPIAAHISTGLAPEDVGEVVKSYVDLDLFDVEESQNTITGIVLNIDNFGNIITNIRSELMDKYFPVGEPLLISHGSDKNKQSWKIPYQKTYENVSKGGYLAIISSSGLLELAVNQGSAHEKFGLTFSDQIRIQKQEND